MSDLVPTISVILPVFNSVKMIEKAIHSVLSQNYPAVELIVIDGGSTDGTVDIIKRYERDIAYWHSKQDGSCGLAINLGLQQATGELTIQLMADDWFEPGIFHAIAEAYMAHPDADIISCGGRIVSYDAGTDTYQTIFAYAGAEAMSMDLKNMCFGIPAMSSRYITRQYVQKIGLLDPFDKNNKHNYSADREYLVRAAVIGCKNVTIDKLGHSYFAHDASATFGKNRENQNKILQEHMDLVVRYFEKFELTAEQKVILTSWYADQSVRLFVFTLLSGKLVRAWQVLRDGMRWSMTAWIKAFISVPVGFAFKNMVSNYYKILLAFGKSRECGERGAH